jgi:hypothetical protein
MSWYVVLSEANRKKEVLLQIIRNQWKHQCVADVSHKPTKQSLYNRVQLYMLDTTFNFIAVSMFIFRLSEIYVKFILRYICDLCAYLMSQAIRTHIARN